MKSNIQKVKAIESQNKRKILSVNQNVDESSGIYFLTRADENGIQYAYIGQGVVDVTLRQSITCWKGIGNVLQTAKRAIHRSWII